MKLMTIVYLCMLLLAGVLVPLAPKIAGLLMLCLLVVWFVHGVFVSTADRTIG